VKDVKEAVKSQVEEKMMEKDKPLVPKRLRARVAKGAAKLASDLMTAAKLAETMSSKMSEEMPQKMLTKGLTVQVEEVYREGAYFVLQMQVLKVDTVILAEAASIKDEEGEQESWLESALKYCLKLIGSKNKDSLETKYLPDIVQSKMQSTMGEMMTKELAEKKMEAEAEVLPEAKQARFFYSMLKQIKEAEAAEKAKGPKGPLGAIKKKK